MGSRVVQGQHYSMRSVNSYIGGPLQQQQQQDLNVVRRVGDRGGGDDVVTDDSLDNDDESAAIECMHESFRNSLPMHRVCVDEDRSSLDNSGSSRDPYSILSLDDVLPIETARARFLDIIVDHFITPHVVEVPESIDDYLAQPSEDKSKRKTREIQYEGDSRFVLPLMYVANLYETLVNEVNVRLSSLNGTREKTIGVALEAAGGLYRKLSKKFPRKGPYSFKRRELATSFETRSRFPELVVQEEKRVRFVVANGLEITEKPSNMHIDDAEWFKRLTGRSEVAVSAQEYKFYNPRHKFRRLASNSISSIPGLPAYPGADDSSPMSSAQDYRPLIEPQNQQQTPSEEHLQNLSDQGQFHPLNQTFHQSLNETQHAIHFSQHNGSAPPSHLPEISHTQQSSAISRHMACVQPLGHLGGRLTGLPTSPAKFCDECGSPYFRETSKFCSECGTKRLGI